MKMGSEFVADASARIGQAKYQTIITSDNHTIIADEPAIMEGADTGISPYGLLLGSLASCTAITLRMYINRKMWIVDEIGVNVEMFKTEDGVTIESQLSFKGELTNEQLKRLVTIADACPIHKLLTGNIIINTSLLPQ